jgi:hypothetical protein
MPSLIEDHAVIGNCESRERARRLQIHYATLRLHRGFPEPAIVAA